ncbi:MAG: hypothetical protein L0323_22410 [Planctomycetes bacterium]|nr:hypothetical protein [Planctomycetota bacterium]
MNASPRPNVPILAGVALVAGAGLSAEIAFTRIFSIALWHHFAYLVVGLALLGFGAAGARMTARGGALLPKDGPLETALARRSRIAAAATCLAVALAARVPCDSIRIFESPSNALGLLALVLLSTVPFYGTGCVLATALAGFGGSAGWVYAADLVGAGLGAALAPAAIGHLGGPGMVVGAAAATAAGAFLFSARSGFLEQVKSAALAVVLAGVASAVRDADSWVRIAPSKELAVVLDKKVTHVEHRRWTPLGRIDVTAPFTWIPQMGGEFGKASDTSWNLRGVTQDGAAPTILFELRGEPGEIPFLPHATTAAVWEARGETPPAKVLVIGVGGGIDVLVALSKGASEVIGVDVNPATLGLLTDRYRAFTGDLPSRKGVRLLAAEGRAFVRSSEEEFDVLQMSGVDTYAALSSGAYSVSEAYLYTVEAFEDYLEHLKHGGFVSVSRFILEPPRETLRLAGIAAEALRRRGVPEPWRHIAILRGSLWASLLVGESAIPEAALERVRAFAAREGYRMAFDPARPGETPFDTLLRGTEEERRAFLSGYGYRVSPVGDDSPFFFNYFRWKNLPSVTGIRPADPVYTQSVPVGHAVLLATFLATALLGAIGILVPLRKASVPPGRFGLYFAALGLAYLFVEIAFLQKLTFFLGHPTYALSVVLSGMLVSSGIGAALSRGLSRTAAERLLPALLLVLLPICGFASRYVLPAFLDLPFPARVAVSLLFLVPCGALMGMPFPIGIERLRARSPSAIPWAFGVNAFATVLASSLSNLLAMEAGFTLLFLLAAAAYVAAFAALRGTGPALEDVRRSRAG